MPSSNVQVALAVTVRIAGILQGDLQYTYFQDCSRDFGAKDIGTHQDFRRSGPAQVRGGDGVNTKC